MNKVINISASEFKQMYDDKCTIVCDVRENDEYQHEHINGAINYPLSAFNKDDLVKITHGKKLVIHCQSGNRTKTNVSKFNELELDEVYILDGGLNAWKSMGCVTIKNNKAPLPIMRQVQIVAGVLIVLGVLLGYYSHSLWYLLSGFVGGGLIFAGVTGYCGMANLLMILPYNRQNKCNTNCVTK